MKKTLKDYKISRVLWYNVSMVKLIVTDSYSDLFSALVKEFENKSNEPEEKNLIFCEAKVSLMTERVICDNFSGSFNTDVYSFGKYLRAKKRISNLLSKEGSAMVIKQILSKVQLKCFKQSKQNLAPTLYDLIIQLKSAKISPEDISSALQHTKGVLKNKLEDICTVYGAYEEYIYNNGFEDQSSMLSYLPQIIYSSDEIENSNVYLFGYSSFTAQMRAAVVALLEKAKSVTAILVEGDNKRLYVNETALYFRNLCKQKSVDLIEEKREKSITGRAKTIVDNLFNPLAVLLEKEKPRVLDVSVLEAKNPYDEICRVAEVIRKSVLKGDCRYRDITVAVNDFNYKDLVKTVFAAHEIPYYYDERKIPENHPLVKLVLDFIDAKRKGFERESLCAFFKNPLFCSDKNLLDNFENYVIKYNVNYGKIKKEFTFPSDDIELCELEKFRQRIVTVFDCASIREMLAVLDVQNVLENYSKQLADAGKKEDAAITSRIYDSVVLVLDEMTLMLKNAPLTPLEYKNVFISGIQAMELPIIPQYNDAVFVGGFKEVALAKAKKLFVIGLTSSVPTVQADVALLSDADISVLEEIQVLIEPKIRVVNHRARESVGLALTAFTENLYLSYPAASTSGKKNIKSQVLHDVLATFSCAEFPKYNGYTSLGQGINTFAKCCGEYAEGARTENFHYDFTPASSFYFAAGEEKLRPLLDRANKEIVKEKLSGDNVSLIENVTSPTTVEDYFKCPYRAFLVHALKIKERDDGSVSVLSVGNLMHEILRTFVLRVKEVNDKKSSDALFESIKNDVLERNEYKKFLSDGANFSTVQRVMRECKGYCYKTYKMLEESAFNKSRTEVSFGDDADYPAISLLDGKIKLKGKIDRVDENEEYFRVVDYKTGSTDASSKALFSGIKLQLYLYAAAVQGASAGGSKKTPAGLYYLPISDKYEKQEDKGAPLAVGKTLSDVNALSVQYKPFLTNGTNDFPLVGMDLRTNKIKNSADEQTIQAHVDYALKVSELAAKRMSEGYIKASPYGDACKYCEFLALCEQKDVNARTLGTITDKTVTDAVGGKGDTNGIN